MKYFILAGEASGDLHGSSLIRAIKLTDPQADFLFWGGDLMAAEANGLRKHIRDLAFMGFWEVLKNLGKIRKNFRECKQQIETFQPDAIILIDYPGFNLRMSKWAFEKGKRVYYYISPQVWAWKSKRVHTVRKFVEKMYVILPFEKAFYKKFGVDVEYVGHPLIDVVENFREDPHFRKKYGRMDKTVIALLPGSRQQEIKQMLPILLKAARPIQNIALGIACAPSIPDEVYEEILSVHDDMGSDIFLVKNQTYDLLRISSAAVVTSGTATLETALFEVPQVVCYKGNRISYWIAKRLIDVPYISLVNLIAKEEVVQELIQDDCKPEIIRQKLQELISPGKRMRIQKKYLSMKGKLYIRGAAATVARNIYKAIS